MSKHTPGPWLINQVQNEPEKITIIDADMCFVAEVWQTYVNGESRQQENAHLIAAAPAMYEALGELIAYLRNNVADEALDNWAPVLKAAYALAQAEGSKP